MSVIILRYVDSPVSTGRTFKFRTLKGAQRKARKLVGSFPRLDPDGYAVSRLHGNCLFFSGIGFDDLFKGTL